MSTIWYALTLKKDAIPSDTNKFSQFNFVFLIELCHVNDNSTLEQIIIKQHWLKEKKDFGNYIRSILEGEQGKVLLLFDGYDEYQKGANKDIDAAMKYTVGECFLILTSRDGDKISKEILDNLDAIIKITGLSDHNILTCAERYLESKELALDLIMKSKEVGIYDLLHIPIILLMVVVLYETTKQLPTGQTEIVIHVYGSFYNETFRTKN